MPAVKTVKYLLNMDPANKRAVCAHRPVIEIASDDQWRRFGHFTVDEIAQVAHLSSPTAFR